MHKTIKDIVQEGGNRIEFWTIFINKLQLRSIAEIGVFKGDFTLELLDNCSSIKEYFMIDPWRNIKGWNKPANVSDSSFEKFYLETLNKTEFFKEKRYILKGTTIEVIESISDESLDFIYIDGDHTLKGITIDLICSWKKIKNNGFVAGDDLCSTIWQHGNEFEPTAVFPFVLFFAEAKNVKIYLLPYNQFLISKNSKGFEVINFSNKDYSKTSLLEQIKEQSEKKPSNFLTKVLSLFH